MSKKQLILEKSLNLFALEGYESVGVARIVTESGVTKPTLYHYFGSKEGLLKSIYEEYFTILINSLNNIPSFNQDIIKTIELVTRTYINFAKKNPSFFILANHLRKGATQSKSYLIVKSYNNQEDLFITNLINSISSYHTNLKGHEEFLIMNYMNLVNGFIEINIINKQLDKIGSEHIHKLTKQFLYGIFSL
jgi:TetR/AcrR family transcriptional regulator